MKAYLSFNLPEDQREYEDANNGWKWRRIVQEIVEKEDLADELRKSIFEIVVEWGLDVYD